jgi:rhomboid protease GluP
MAKLRITYNAPVILTFALASAIVQLAFGRETQLQYFAAWPEFHDWRGYLGLFSHVLGHADWNHLLGNFSIILLIGPILEERHGSPAILGMIAITALVTGLVNVAFTDTFLVGASGIVFMFVILASMANIRSGEIPLTFIAVAVLYLGREVVGAFQDDQVSQMAHLLGGAAGAAFGFLGAGRRPASPTAPPRPTPARPTIGEPRAP